MPQRAPQFSSTHLIFPLGSLRKGCACAALWRPHRGEARFSHGLADARMVEDIVKAGILPPGAISIICGSARDLLGHVREEDVVSFTGSGDTAARIRSHANVLRRSSA